MPRARGLWAGFWLISLAPELMAVMRRHSQPWYVLTKGAGSLPLIKNNQKEREKQLPEGSEGLF